MLVAFVRTLAFALALFPALALAQQPMLPGFPPGVFQSRAAIDAAPSGGAYVGPGDVKSGWLAYWGYRAFSAATRGNKLVNLCNSTGGTDVLCADASSSATTGALVIPGSLTSFCPGVNCTVKTHYDISGATNCTSAACDQTQVTIANRAILTANSFGSKSCGVGTSANSTGYANANFSGQAQPFSVSAVSQLSSTSGTPFYFGSSSGGGTGFGSLGTPFGFYASNNVTGATSDLSPHAFQSVAASASSFLVTDTSVGSTQSSGGTAVGPALTLFEDSFNNHWNGTVCEVGLYPAAFTPTDASNMYANQHTYWGF